MNLMSKNSVKDVKWFCHVSKLYYSLTNDNFSVLLLQQKDLSNTGTFFLVPRIFR